jgi:L-asparaginase/Glu-tRNA(Gln) amidotransferase subunit D
LQPIRRCCARSTDGTSAYDAVPADLGGGGLTHRELGDLVRRLAGYCGSTALAYSMHSHLVAAAVWRHRHGQPAEALLRKVAQSELVLVSTGPGDEIHDAHSVYKSNTTEVSTFLSAEGLVGEVQFGQARYFRAPYTRHTMTSDFTLDGVESLPEVDIIYMHQGVSGALIDAAVAAGAKGVVTAGVGNGNMTDAALASLTAAAAAGVVSVRSSRVPTGVIGRMVEIDDDALGFVASYGLSPQKARILLRLALLTTSDPTAIQQFFAEY